MQITDLFSTLSIFSEELDLDDSQRYGLLDRNIKSGNIGIENLKNELIESINNANFDWIALAKETKLLLNPSLYSKVEIIDYVKLYLWDYLYPEKKITNDKVNALGNEINRVLKLYSLNDGWMDSYDLYFKLKGKLEFENLEYYNLWKVPFKKYNIERKRINEKDILIGYLRYSSNPHWS